jgi:hypothetical protein
MPPKMLLGSEGAPPDANITGSPTHWIFRSLAPTRHLTVCAYVDIDL